MAFKLEKSWIWRLLIVLYAGVYLYVAFLAALASLEQWPHKEQDPKLTNAVCSNGKTINLSRNDIYEYDLTNGSKEDKMLRQGCYTLTRPTVQPGEKLPIESLWDKEATTYTIQRYTVSKGHIGFVALYFLGAFLVGFLVVEAVKTVVLFVMGVSIWRGGIAYAINFLADLFTPS